MTMWTTEAQRPGWKKWWCFLQFIQKTHTK